MPAHANLEAHVQAAAVVVRRHLRKVQRGHLVDKACDAGGCMCARQLVWAAAHGKARPTLPTALFSRPFQLWMSSGRSQMGANWLGHQFGRATACRWVTEACAQLVPAGCFKAGLAVRLPTHQCQSPGRSGPPPACLRRVWSSTSP